MSSVPVADLYRQSDIRIAGGVVQWNILSNLPRECYSFYSFQLYMCSITSFTILPTGSLSDAALNMIISGETVMVCLIRCVVIHNCWFARCVCSKSTFH